MNPGMQLAKLGTATIASIVLQGLVSREVDILISTCHILFRGIKYICTHKTL